MSRISGGDVIVVKATSNVYTALAAAGTVALVVGLIALYIEATALGVNFFK